MRFLSGSSVALSAVTLFSAAVQGDKQSYCPPTASGICYGIGIPSSSAVSNSGNIYFQLSAPTSYSWVALGTGTGMAGSNMFVMYQDGNGNVTVSPRHASFHNMPTQDTTSTAAKLTILAGSGVSSDGQTMTANVACANCQSWSGGGTLSLTSTESSWIAAWMSGAAIKSTNLNQAISKHDENAIFLLDLTKATLTSDSNPFVTTTSSSSGANNSTSASGSSGSSGSAVTVVSLNTSLLPAHGIIMALVMVVLYPLGALLMPLLGKWMVHAGFQFFTFLLMWVGFGLGVKVALDRHLLFNQAHTIIGTVVTCLFVLQPFLGIAHHRYYTKHQGRGVISHGHIWFGRALLIIGVVNGGLGLQLVHAPNSLIIAYSVVAVVIALCYVIAKVLVSIRRKQQHGRGARRGLKEVPSPHSPPGVAYA